MFPQDEEGRNALMTAAESGNDTLVSYLLDAGKRHMFCTPLLLCKQQNEAAESVYYWYFNMQECLGMQSTSQVAVLESMPQQRVTNKRQLPCLRRVRSLWHHSVCNTL